MINYFFDFETSNLNTIYKAMPSLPSMDFVHEVISSQPYLVGGSLAVVGAISFRSELIDLVRRVGTRVFIGNRESFLAYVQINGLALKYTSETLRNDREIVLAAIQSNSFALQYASVELRNDREIVLAAIQKYGRTLQYASATLRNDREIVLASIQHREGHGFQYASESLRNDREIVLAALQRDSEALQYASDALKNNRTIVHSAIIRDINALQHASDALRNNRDFVLAAVQRDSRALEHASEALKNNRTIVLAAVLRYGATLQYASETLRNDPDLIFAAAQSNRDTPEVLRNDREILLAAVQNNGLTLQHASEEFRNDREIVLAAVQNNGFALAYASESLRNNWLIVLVAVQEAGWTLQHASEELRNDREIVLAALQNNGCALQHASEKLRNDRNFVLTAARNSTYGILEHAAEAWRADREIVIAALQRDGEALRHASEALRNDRELVLIATIQSNGRALQYASEALRTDPAIFLLTPQKDIGVYAIDPQIILNHPTAALLKFAEILQRDQFFPTIRYQNSEGVDQGGISRDFISKLFNALCSSEKTNLPHNESCASGFLPQIDPDFSLNEAKQLSCYQTIGEIFGFALNQHQNILIGRHFSPILFQLIHSLSSEEIIHLAQEADETTKKFRDQLLTIFLKSEFSYLSDKKIQQILDNTLPENLQEDSKNCEEFLQSIGFPKILAATRAISESIPRFLAGSWDEMKGASPQELANKIQGSLTKELVLNALKMNGAQNEQTEQHLRMWLDEANEQDLEQFVLAISGSPTLNPSSTLNIYLYSGEGGKLPIFHTCGYTMDLSTEYTDFEMFKSKLEQSLSSVADGFQFS